MNSHVTDNLQYLYDRAEIVRLTTIEANVNTATSLLEDLMTYAVPAGTLTTAGQALSIYAQGLVNASTAPKTIYFYCGGTPVTLTSSTGPFNWTSRVYVVRTSAAREQLVTELNLPGTTYIPVLGTGLEPCSGAITVKYAATGGGHTQINMIVSLLR